MQAVISSTVAENVCMMHVHCNASQHCIRAIVESIMHHSRGGCRIFEREGLIAQLNDAEGSA